MKNHLIYPLIIISNVAIAQDNNPVNTATNGIEHIEVTRQWQPYRGNVPLIDTPQAVDRINADDIKNQGITRFMDALDFSPSIVRQNNSGGMFDSFAIRGFSGDENNPTGYLVNGFNSRGYNGNRNPANIETIEVMKGPGSALYGQGEPGGTVNIITKKPQFTEQGYIQAALGNFDKKQFEFDHTKGLTDEVAYRINGFYEDSDTYRDHVDFKSVNLSPSLLWNISDNTSLIYEMEILDQHKPLERGVYILDNDFDSVDTSAFYGDVRDGAHEVKALGHQLLLNHQLNDQWHMLTGLAYRDSSFKGQSSDTELSAGRQLIYTNPNLLSRQKRERDYQAKDLSARFELSGDASVAGFKNNLLIGLDYYHFQLDTDYRVWRTAWGSGDTTYAIDPNNPDYTMAQPETSPTTLTSEEQNGLGFYAQDIIELTDNVNFLLGFRVDNFNQQILNKIDDESQKNDQTEVSSRFGLVYKLDDKVNLYTSYAEGFRPNPGLDSDRNAFDPETTQSYEIGLKWQDVAERFSGSLAWFDASKTNMLTAEPDTGLSATLGEVESQGVELEFNTLLTDDTSIEFAYAYTDARTAKDLIDNDWGVPIPKGSRLINVAEHVGHITLKHYTDIMGKEAYFGATVNYVGDRLGETTDPDYILPAYTLVNLSAGVDINSKFRVMFDVNNVFNEQYFESSYHKLWTMPGEPINFTASVKYAF
ncbi:TonB-dependent siderophore receptor [Shewanella intestini]|uniref:TonB-dependent siderophore receptor n=1 Tax=Shewanella intestini TaxID=2017544 RepID=A0ABS5I2W2_9GAMM|nr:TonB-dependent siderophore receptor [Shewanella sp. XMDDZSB0408]MBR9728009.1 TonB-dependent siderophore receptor [Shewanella intestini]MRG36440.1 TonB-dependent siderophore receptor [Shewanella sp. XMDDZSB0408]